MSYDHRKVTSFDLTSTTFLPGASSSSSRLTVEFDFNLKSDKVILVEGRDSGALFFLQNFPPSYRRTSASSAVRNGEPAASLDDMADAVYEAIGDAVDVENLVDMVQKAWEEVVGQGFLRKHGVVRLGYEVRIENWHVYTVGFGGGGDASGMVPAAEMLEKYEVREGEEEEKGCCICLEEIGGEGGGGALRMPCLHVFHGHGDCITAWLRKRCSCPLCRYEMPTRDVNGPDTDLII